jgi:phage tail-like protein
MNAPLPRAPAPFARIGHIPAPPFEPASLLLNGRTGWHVHPSAWAAVEAGLDGTLQLAEDPASARAFTEPSGSFGGLVPPGHVAVAGDGTVYLLDREHHRLKRFDPCRCGFADVACIGGEGGGAREWRAPGGIAIGCGKLYVSDSGVAAQPKRNRRVSVFSLGGLALYGHLVPRGVSGWQPVAVAVDGRGNAWVTDRLNGMVHQFSPALRFVRSLAGFSEPGAIAVDACGLLYVLHDGPLGRALRVIDSEGREQALPGRVAAAAERFAPLSFSVDAQGRIDLHALCIPRDGEAAPVSTVFDEHGEPVLPAPLPAAVQFGTEGSAVVGPLDSKIHACTWHRVVLQGSVPPGARIRVESFTAEEIIPPDQLADFARWETGQVARQIGDEGWDCLLRSGAGRYLWLRLTLLGDGWATPAIAAIEIEFPRIGPRQYLPAVFGAEAGSADFTDRFLALFDTTWRGLERSVDTLPGLFDPLSAPAARVDGAPVDSLTWLASWIGLQFDRSWNEAKRRRLLKQAGAALDRRGTLAGLRDALVLLLGLDRGAACACPGEPVTRCGCRPANCAPAPVRPVAWRVPPLVLEHFRVRRWLYLGQGRLGERSMLWGQRIVNRSQLNMNAQAGVTQLVARPDPLHDPFASHAHQFTVFVPACVRDDDAGRKALENLLAGESPAHTRWYVEYVEPRFRIGVQSTLGFDAVIAAPPPVHALGGQRLGGGVLGESQAAQAGGRTWQAGVKGRLGVTSRIN